MRFKHLLNGQEIEEPRGFEDFTTSIIRDEKDRIIRYDFPLDLEFVGDGYTLIEDAYQDDISNELEYRIIGFGNSGERVEAIGIVQMANCTFNLTAKPKRTVRVEINDNVYQSQVFNNKKAEFVVGSQTSIDGELIEGVPKIDLIMFNPYMSTNQGDTREAYDVFEVLKFATRYVSNGTVEMTSNWYNSLDKKHRIAMVQGIELRNPAQNSRLLLKTSFEELFNELWKRYNLYLIVDDILTDSPKLRLETEEYLYPEVRSLVIDRHDEVKRRLDFERLYNIISLGSASAKKELGVTNLHYYTPLIGFSDETFNITNAQANNELNLTTKFVSSHNEIVRAIIDDDDKNDDAIFLVQYNNQLNRATPSEYFPDGAVNLDYNEQLLNLNIAKRFNLAGDIVLGIDNLAASFRAGQSSPDNEVINVAAGQGEIEVMNEVFDFDNDSTAPNFDTSNNFDLSTDKFTAPTGGLYRFEALIDFRNVGDLENNGYTVRTKFYFIVNGTEIVEGVDQIITGYLENGFVFEPITVTGSEATVDVKFAVTSFGGGGQITSSEIYRYTYEIATTLTLEPGDTVEVYREVYVTQVDQFDVPTLIAFQITDSYFTNPTSPLDGGVYVASDPDRYYIGLYELGEWGIPREEWDLVMSRPIGRIELTAEDDRVRNCYIKNISRKIVSGSCTAELIFNRKQPVY